MSSEKARELPGDLKWKLDNLNASSGGIVGLTQEEWEYVRAALSEKEPPASAAPEDVLRDAERYRWLREWRLPVNGESQPAAWIEGAGNRYIESELLTGAVADEIIDAAMLAAVKGPQS